MPPVEKWRATLGPGPTEMYLSTTPSYATHGNSVSAETAIEIQAWATRLEVLHDERLDIAAERLVRARAERNAWEDQLIDSVIAWENICGRGETTFRVTAALAKLLERPGSDREKLLSTLGAVYGDRSALVHGRGIKRPATISSARAATAIARSALRTIYLEREALIPFSADERATQLLLQEP